MHQEQGDRREWFSEWFDETYLALYRHRDSEEAEAFIHWLGESHVADGKHGVVDLACGAGRHSWAMARSQGWRVVGVDLSATLLDRAAAVQPEQGVPTPRFVRADLRALPLSSSCFGLAVNLFTSFGYFYQRREHLSALRETARLLRPGGRFLLDLMNPRVAVRTLVPSDEQDLGPLHVKQERIWRPASSRIEKTIRIQYPDGRRRNVVESVRLFTEGEIRDLMQDAGMEIDRILGSYQGESFDREKSERMILVARKSI